MNELQERVGPPRPHIREPWSLLPELGAKACERNWIRAVPKGHPLYDVPANALARCVPWALFRLSGHASQFAAICLDRVATPQASSAPPKFVLYRDAEDLEGRCLVPMHEKWRREAHQFIKQHGRFTVHLAPHTFDYSLSLPVHEKALRPLLATSRECWVYGLSPTSELWDLASPILKRDKGRHRVLKEVEAVRGYELFWNAIGGSRGSILMLMDAASLLAAKIFQHCARPSLTGNFAAAHSPAAVKVARAQVQDDRTAALLLPRTNGIEWMDVLANPELCLHLFESSLADGETSRATESLVAHRTRP